MTTTDTSGGPRGAPVGEAGVHEPALDLLDAAVHHVARGDAAGAGPCIVDGDLGDPLGALLLVERVGSVRVKDAAVAVRRVLAQADVAREEQRREELGQEAEREDDRRLGRRRVGSLGVLVERGRAA